MFPGSFPSEGRDVGLVGTANTGITAEEYGSGPYHVTKLTVDTAMPAIAGGAALAVGKLLYTLPAGNILILAAHMALTLQEDDGNITADTPDGGLGTVIGSGAVSVLDGTGTFEDILTGQTFNDCDGTEEVAMVQTSLTILSTAAKTVHFNLADTWASSGEDDLALTGTVLLVWIHLGA